MAIREILLLGNPELYEVSSPVKEPEIAGLKTVVDDLHYTMMDFRRRYGVGRAIAVSADRKIADGTLGLRSPVNVSRNLDFAKRVFFGPIR